MQTRRDIYNWLAILPLAVAIVYGAGSIQSGWYAVTFGIFVGAALLTMVLWLLAWRCDVRLRTERQHAQLMAALNALRPPKDVDMSILRKLETQKKVR